MYSRSQKEQYTPIGQMRHIVEVQKDTGTEQDGSRVRIPNFTFVAKVYAKVVQSRANKHAISEQKFVTATYEVNMRYMHGLTEEMQILYEGRTLSIVSVNDLYGRRREHELICTELKPQ